MAIKRYTPGYKFETVMILTPKSDKNNFVKVDRDKILIVYEICRVTPMVFEFVVKN